MTKAEQFFYDNAGYSYDPATETVEDGKRRCADLLARAEAWARDEMCIFRWEEDPDAEREKGCRYPYHFCVAYHPDGRSSSLSGIDLGKDWMACPYRRVVEAELASELLDEA